VKSVYGFGKKFPILGFTVRVGESVVKVNAAPSHLVYNPLSLYAAPSQSVHGLLRVYAARMAHRPSRLYAAPSHRSMPVGLCMSHQVNRVPPPFLVPFVKVKQSPRLKWCPALYPIRMCRQPLT
jgi:hypothetical protein